MTRAKPCAHGLGKDPLSVVTSHTLGHVVAHSNLKIIASIFLLSLILLSSCGQKSVEDDISNKVDERLKERFRSGSKELGDDLFFTDSKHFKQINYQHSDYVQSGEPSSWYKTTTGEYEVIDNQVILYPKQIEKSIAFYDSTIVLDSFDYFESDTTRIPTEFKIVEWSKNVYLLSADSIQEFGMTVANDFVEFAK